MHHDLVENQHIFLNLFISHVGAEVTHSTGNASAAEEEGRVCNEVSLLDGFACSIILEVCSMVAVLKLLEALLRKGAVPIRYWPPFHCLCACAGTQFALEAE